MFLPSNNGQLQVIRMFGMSQEPPYLKFWNLISVLRLLAIKLYDLCSWLNLLVCIRLNLGFIVFNNLNFKQRVLSVFQNMYRSRQLRGCRLDSNRIHVPVLGLNRTHKRQCWWWHNCHRVEFIPPQQPAYLCVRRAMRVCWRRYCPCSICHLQQCHVHHSRIGIAYVYTITLRSNC